MGKFNPASCQRHRAGSLVLVLALVSIPAAITMGADLPRPADPKPIPQQDSPSELDTLLTRMSRVASLYTDEALRFTADAVSPSAPNPARPTKRRRVRRLSSSFIAVPPS